VKRIKLGSFLLGFGLLGAADGIILHQLLQWHSFYMHTDHPHRIVSDGLFHASSVVIILVGTFILVRSASLLSSRNRWALVLGYLSIGGGAFHLLDTIINHWWLQTHHIRQGHPDEAWYDVYYLLIGIVLLLVGLVTGRKAMASLPRH
jgi:uncharacterized membrane protein